MKLLKKFLLSITLVVIALVITPQVVPELNSIYSVQAASIKINKTKKTLNVKETYKLKISGTTKKVKWSSNNSKVAKVNSNGKVTAKKAGTATITAKVGGKKYKCKIKVENPKINKKSKTISVSETYKLKVSGTTQKVKWSSSDKSIASVNSKGKVTAKKAGTVTITAKVGNKKLKSKITVVAYEYAKKISVTYLKTDTSVIGIFTNKNSCAVSFNPQMVFYDANGNIQSTTSDYNYCFEPNSTIALEFYSYNTSTYKSQKYSSYKLNIGKVEKSFYTGYSNKIKVNAIKTDSSIIAEVTNASGTNLDTIRLCVVYYDSNGNAIGSDYNFADCSVNGSVDYVTLDYPYDSEYKTIIPASYKIYIDYAYAYYD